MIILSHWTLIGSINLTRGILKPDYWPRVAVTATLINLADLVEFYIILLCIMNFIRKFRYFLFRNLEKKKTICFIVNYFRFIIFQFHFYFIANQLIFQKLFLVINFRLYLLAAAHFDLLVSYLNIKIIFQSLTLCFIISVTFDACDILSKEIFLSENV